MFNRVILIENTPCFSYRCINGVGRGRCLLCLFYDLENWNSVINIKLAQIEEQNIGCPPSLQIEQNRQRPLTL